MISRNHFPALARRVARGLLRIERELICCGNLTLQQFETMRELREAGVLVTTAVAERLGIDLSTASRNLAVLERNGYVARVAVKADGRAVGNRLTAEGERCVGSLSCDERDVFRSILERIPKQTRATLVEHLELLADALEQVHGDRQVQHTAPRGSARASVKESCGKSECQAVGTGGRSRPVP